jgi:hypothetical protein
MAPDFVGYIPIATTFLALAFSVVLVRRYRARGGPHLLWWAAGTFTYALGTITESLTTLIGWHEPVFRAWYITGALLGGAPLAQGTVYLLLPRRVANRLSVALVATMIFGGACVLASPIIAERVRPYHLSGNVLAWTWVRGISPFINLYALIFLVGGAIVSAIRYHQQVETRHRFIGNVYIAVGALLPGIGGSFTRFGYTEVLYVTEFIGLALIFVGYRYNTASGLTAAAPAKAPAMGSAVTTANEAGRTGPG